MEKMCKEELKNLIRTTSFAMLELALYLDTHPDCTCGIETYHKYHKTFNEAVECFERRFEPLTIYGVYDKDYWTWVNKPWPWQKECD